MSQPNVRLVQPMESLAQCLLLPQFTVQLQDLIENSQRRAGLSINCRVETAEGSVDIRVGKRTLEDRKETPTVYITGLFVNPKNRRRGLMRALIQQAQRCATLYGHALMVHEVQDRNIEQFLPRVGFSKLEFSNPPSFYKTVEQMREEHAALLDSFMGLSRVGLA